MADPRFFERQGPFELSALAKLSGAELAPGADPDKVVRDVATLDAAQGNDLSFIDNPNFLADFRASKAGACVMALRNREAAPKGMNVVLSEAPYKAFGLIARAFYPLPPIAAGRAPNAEIDAAAQVGEGCAIESGAVIAAGAEIGADCYIGPNVVIAANVVIGDEARIHAGATLSHCLMGKRVTIYPGARIGQDGFGFAPDPAGHISIPQLGRVLIGDDVEIGANTSIDRGAGSDTIVGDGCRIDNLVQIGHNVVFGRGCIMAAQVGIAGSTHFGDFVMAGGQVGFSGHLTIGDGAQIAAKSGVITDIPAGAKYGGDPAVPVRDWHRQTISLSRLVKRKGSSDG